MKASTTDRCEPCWREIDVDFGANPLTTAEVLVDPARIDRLEKGRLISRS